jgi:2-polyprenyl-3-methyl-5-hydroxy-6-metoxy-1,4-benzoquinol methylase
MCINPSFENLFKNLESEDIIDLGCGTGFFTEKVRHLTSGLVYGLDVSPEMIEVAKANTPPTIVYYVADVSQPVQIEQKFDIVLCSFLLNYAQDENALDGFLANAFSLLKPGGRVVGINTNFDLKVKDFNFCTKYGITYAVNDEVE